MIVCEQVEDEYKYVILTSNKYDHFILVVEKLSADDEKKDVKSTYIPKETKQKLMKYWKNG